MHGIFNDIQRRNFQGARVDGFSHEETARTVQISARGDRGFSTKVCNIRRDAPTSGCDGSPIFRYGYNRQTKRCEDYITLDCFLKKKMNLAHVRIATASAIVSLAIFFCRDTASDQVFSARDFEMMSSTSTMASCRKQRN
ncbi:hypothetical protein V5799_027393 [Amblyomma americanum]|uniref:Uncharacterized protein n=1 Tax=Amblyomma americanum TaxID=6943 RepID=A0AAQ4DFV0_AMBAM